VRTPQDLLHLVELRRPADPRGTELGHRVAAVVGPAVETHVEQRAGEEAAQQPLALLGVERLPGHLVPDQLDPVGVPAAEDRQVQECGSRRREGVQMMEP
jgi:hypothetical protein